MRFFCFALLLLTLSCTNHKTDRTELIHFIPENASVVLKTSNIESLKSAIQNNDVIQKLSKTNSYKNLENKLESLSLLHPEGELLICFSKEAKDSLQYSIITKYHKNLFKTDSLSNYIEETLAYKNKSVTKSSLNNNTFYSTIIDSIFFTSSSKKIIDAAFLNADRNIELEKIYNTTNKDESLSFIIKNENEFINYISYIFNNPLGAKKIAKNARKVINENYTQNKMVEKSIDYYSNLINNSK